uniref:Anti-proliferative protein domain-containing protein n=1 Tax=Periophthalmus magnuspinnatus TaxID=409849 RepID=A0A3B4AYT0_9GOBI
MHLEVKVALNFIVSYLYNKLPRRRADLFGEELERILVSRFEGHWYPEAPLRGSAFRCLHLGAPRDPVVELAAKRSGLDTEEVRANVPAELSVWIDPYEVSYQIGEKGPVKVLYLEDPPGLGCDGENKSAGFNPDAQVFVPISSQASPTLFALPYLSTQQPARPQPITFTTASFAATKFGSTKMKKSSGGVPAAVPPVPRMLSRSPPLSTPELLKHKPLSLSLHSLGGPIPSQLSPNAKEFIYPGSPGQLYFDSDTPPIQAHTSPFQPSHTVSNQPPFDPFSSPPPSQSVGIIGSGGGPISYVEKPPFVDGLGNYNLQYPSPSFQPVVLAN